MPRFSTPLLALASAAFLAAAGAAQASDFGVSSQRWRLTWSSLTISGQPESGLRIQCSVTLDGSFHADEFGKTPGALLGFITGATVGSCTGGTATALAGTLPWHVVYESFTGTLPAVTSVSGRFLNLSIGFTTGGGLPCLLTTGSGGVTATALLNGAGTVTGVRLDETDVVTPTGIFLCRALRVALSGTGTATGAFGEPFVITLV